MSRAQDGYWQARAAAGSGDRYFLRVDDKAPVPDPVSRSLPEGVHGRTEIVDAESFPWSDREWRGAALEDYILYELHTGTFTTPGTFEGIIQKFSYLKEMLGVTVIELMPVDAFPGERNWGYDGVSPYAVQASYGGPFELKRLVDGAHNAGLAVMLDVVYNHLGNEGNYLESFGPYFTDRHHTPWGKAVNYDGPESEHVRRFVIENALYWIREYHIDGLRLDAVQTIHDDSPKHILAEIKEEVEGLAQSIGRKVCVIAETDQNDARLVRPPAQQGYGLDAFWSDDFHHAVHTALTGESAGYYQDFGGEEQIAKALQEGYVFQGEHFRFWNGPRGTSASGVPLLRNVICIQNHDQVGNRAKGERLTELAGWAARRAAAALLLLAPHTPLLFMGQEYDEPAPFQFFSSYTDPALKEAVRRGRREEFKEFVSASSWNEVPDPEDPETFLRSKLHWELANAENEMLDWYSSLIALRKKYVLEHERTCQAETREGILRMQVPAERERATVLVFASLKRGQPLPKPLESGWEKVLEAEDESAAVAVWVR